MGAIAKGGEIFDPNIAISGFSTGTLMGALAIKEAVSTNHI